MELTKKAIILLSFSFLLVQDTYTYTYTHTKAITLENMNDIFTHLPHKQRELSLALQAVCHFSVVLPSLLWFALLCSHKFIRFVPQGIFISIQAQKCWFKKKEIIQDQFSQVICISKVFSMFSYRFNLIQLCQEVLDYLNHWPTPLCKGLSLSLLGALP